MQEIISPPKVDGERPGEKLRKAPLTRWNQPSIFATGFWGQNGKVQGLRKVPLKKVLGGGENNISRLKTNNRLFFCVEMGCGHFLDSQQNLRVGKIIMSCLLRTLLDSWPKKLTQWFQ